MPTVTGPRVIVATATPHDETIAWLQRQLVDPELRAGAAPGTDLDGCATLILDGRTGLTASLAACRVSRAILGDDGPPILMLTAADPKARVAALESGADLCLSEPFGRDELLAQVKSLARWGRAVSRLRQRADEAQQINKRLRLAYQQINSDLDLARRLQAGFLPATLPEVGQARFAVCYRPCGQVGGDFYDVLRLDDCHVAFYLADVMGHGVPASLLTIFLKKAVQPEEFHPEGPRIAAPGDVLARLNRELIGLGLDDLPFITMVYGILDTRRGGVRLARAAHPYPLHIPTTGEPRTWETRGTILGVFEADFPEYQQVLAPGDRLLLYTDGHDRPDDAASDVEPLMNAVERHRGLPLRSLVNRLALDLSSAEPAKDDFTLLGIEFSPPRPPEE